MTQTIIITDRNETKALYAWGFTGTPIPRNPSGLVFGFDATDALFEARRAYALNHSIPVLSFISASKYVDAAIYDHRAGGGK